ncbi:MAG: HEAT repeat domain-containing protein [Pirellulales bacterium]
MRFTIAWLLVIPALLSQAARGDVFELVNKGEIRGELVNKDERPRRKYVIRTEDGGEITLDRKQVARVDREKPAEVEYNRLKTEEPDTVAGHWKMSEYCREHRLVEQREDHLNRIIELEPDHADARRILGYHKIDGRWATQDQIMTERGYKQYQGRWVLPQEIELAEEKRQIEQEQIEWRKKVKRWRGWLEKSDRSEEAERGLATIEDPMAIKAIDEVMEKERSEQVRIMLVESLGRIGTSRAVSLLIDRTINDPQEDVRLSALDELENHASPDVTSALVGYLTHKDNAIVNRAALALGRVGDPTAVRPLIDSLVTKHKFTIATSSGQTNAGFTKDGSGGGGFTTGPSARVIEQTLRNESVRDALLSLTEQNFDFNIGAWRTWHAGQRKFRGVNARRD